MTKKCHENCIKSSERAIDLLNHEVCNKPVIVDFDETLFLSNSTQEYLNTLYPRVFGVALLALMNYLQPWNWLPEKFKGEISRDWLRVVTATVLFPWTPIIWQWRARRLASLYQNTKLNEALTQSTGQIIIASLGFGFIIRPILKNIPLKIQDLITCSFWQGPYERFVGKQVLVEARIGSDAIDRAVFITDSINDLPLLSLVAKPCLINWPETKKVSMMAGVYLPFFYSERIKRPSQSHFVKQVLTDDLAILILGFSWLSHHPAIHSLSMALLLVSFNCIYEIGYWENDKIGEQFEEKPVLSDRYRQTQFKIPLIQPWIWALCLAIPGLILLELSQIQFNYASVDWQLNIAPFNELTLKLGSWFALLVLVRVIFWSFNHVDKLTRIWFYPLLQATKCLGFVAIAITNQIGAMLFVAQIISRSIPYIIYRWQPEVITYPREFPDRLCRLLIFELLLAAILVEERSIVTILTWQVLAITVLLSVRATKDIWLAVSQAKPILRFK
ncbi:HAD family hydrolase [Myxosarcina sp. GI1]|uniref:HAD family hydrolase n=1 Tax=Myxosarcina sp. GI1 TaxID=1541065 RepID=UPI0006920E04|nr:HAD family hydrolase [Myxosarcina sp. GI1]